MYAMYATRNIALYHAMYRGFAWRFGETLGLNFVCFLLFLRFDFDSHSRALSNIEVRRQWVLCMCNSLKSFISNWRFSWSENLYVFRLILITFFAVLNFVIFEFTTKLHR